jgi:hypothetical protein
LRSVAVSKSKVFRPDPADKPDKPRVRSIFKWLWESELIAAPVRFGPDFKRPSLRVLRLHKAAAGPKLFTAEGVEGLLDVVVERVVAEEYRQVVRTRRQQRKWCFVVWRSSASSLAGWRRSGIAAFS